MTKTIASRFPTLAALGLAALAFSAAPAGALSSRTFVSGHGTDSAGCGTVAAPCRHFQKAHDNTAAGGTIIVRDTGDYGPVHIAKSISIVNDGAGTASVRATFGEGVTIDSVGAADAVHLRGLSITGGGGGNGINAVNLGSLTIVNCVVRGFGDGIHVFADSGLTNFSISDTIVENNVGGGINVFTGGGSAAGVIDHVLANNNRDGIRLNGAVKATVAESVLSNNDLEGMDGESGTSLTLRNVTASHNVNFGFVQQGTGTTRLAHSVATGNRFGVTAFGGIVETYGDNDLRGNTSGPGSGSLTTVADQ